MPPTSELRKRNRMGFLLVLTWEERRSNGGVTSLAPTVTEWYFRVTYRFLGGISHGRDISVVFSGSRDLWMLWNQFFLYIFLLEQEGSLMSNDYTIYLFGALIDFFRHQTSRYEYFELFGHMLPWTHWDTSSVIFYVQDTVDIIVICQYVFSFLGLHMEIKLWTQIYFKHHLTMLSVGKISLVVL
jgi:hypothetical protein